MSDQTFLNLNIQPVIPIKLFARWNAIARTIIPIDSLPGPDGTRLSGVGDIQEEVFFTPAKPGRVIWGVGPILSMPTSTSSGTSTGTWAAGPAAVIVKMAGPWVVAGLLSQAWPMSLAAQYYYNVNRPDAAAGQQLRFVVSLLYPTRK